jgi:hypothetical protein
MGNGDRLLQILGSLRSGLALCICRHPEGRHMAPTATVSRPTPTVRPRNADQFPALRSAETNEKTRTLAGPPFRTASTTTKLHQQRRDRARIHGRRRVRLRVADRYAEWRIRLSRPLRCRETFSTRGLAPSVEGRNSTRKHHGSCCMREQYVVRRRADRARPVGVVVDRPARSESCRPSALRSRPIHHRTGGQVG